MGAGMEWAFRRPFHSSVCLGGMGRNNHSDFHSIPTKHQKSIPDGGAGFPHSIPAPKQIANRRLRLLFPAIRETEEGFEEFLSLHHRRLPEEGFWEVISRVARRSTSALSSNILAALLRYSLPSPDPIRRTGGARSLGTRLLSSQPSPAIAWFGAAPASSLPKVYKNAAQWKSRSFPHFVDLCIIFGRDRATGNNAQSAADMVEEIDQEMENFNVRGDEADNMNDIPFSFPTNTPTNTSEECTSQRSSKKRSRSLDPLIECITNGSNLIGKHLQEAAEKFSKAISVDMEIMEQKKRINAEIAKVSGITTTERFRAVKMIAKDEDLMVVFFSLLEGDRDEWVAALLRGDI